MQPKHRRHASNCGRMYLAAELRLIHSTAFCVHRKPSEEQMHPPIFFVEAKSVGHHRTMPIAHVGAKATVIVYSLETNGSNRQQISDEAIKAAFALKNQLSNCGYQSIVHPRFLTGKLIYSSNRGFESVSRKRKNIRFRLVGVQPSFIETQTNVFVMHVSDETQRHWRLHEILAERLRKDFPTPHSAATT